MALVDFVATDPMPPRVVGRWLGSPLVTISRRPFFSFQCPLRDRPPYRKQLERFRDRAFDLLSAIHWMEAPSEKSRSKLNSAALFALPKPYAPAW